MKSWRAPWRPPSRRVLVVYCHPCPDSFAGAVRDRAVATLTGGAEVRVTDLYADGFDPAFSAAEHAAHLQAGAAPDVARYADDLRWCDTLVLVYPTWWAGQPAMLKGWIDRVWVCGVAWELPDGSNRLRPLLRDVRTIVALTTHGSRKYVNMVEGEGGKRTVTRSLRLMCHPLTRTVWCALYNCDRSDDVDRGRYLDRVEARLAALVR
ncbi:MAG: flavodoxin family protein [Ilumatobacter sp.]|nr:flavodoxin family protein [Ilumatobacter sp.]